MQLSTSRNLACTGIVTFCAAQTESLLSLLNLISHSILSHRASLIFCSAKSTELLHSPPVYESDIDTRDHDFYDYAVPPGVQDDDFYYVSWEDPIYDVFQEYDYSGA